VQLNVHEQHTIDRLLSSWRLRKEFDLTQAEVECLEVKLRDDFQRFTPKEQVVIDCLINNSEDQF